MENPQLIRDHQLALALNYEFDYYRWHFNLLMKQTKDELFASWPFMYPF